MSDIPPVTPPVVRKSWRAGTLTYTAGGLVVLFLWLLWGDFAWQMKERGTQPVVQVMLQKFQASDFLIGFLVLSLPASIGIFLTPIISYRSDRHRGRWGRRIPFLLATAPLTTVAMCGMAFSPWIGTWLHGRMGWGPGTLNLTVILVLGFFWTLLDFASVVAAANLRSTNFLRSTGFAWPMRTSQRQATPLRRFCTPRLPAAYRSIGVIRRSVVTLIRRAF